MSKEFTIVIAVIAVIFVIVLMNQRKDKFTPRRFRVGRDSSMVSSPSNRNCQQKADDYLDSCYKDTKNYYRCQQRAGAVEANCEDPDLNLGW
jgi:hypothetical protein